MEIDVGKILYNIRLFFLWILGGEPRREPKLNRERMKNVGIAISQILNDQGVTAEEWNYIKEKIG